MAHLRARTFEGPHRLQVCAGCRGTHLTLPEQIGPHAMTWPVVVCATPECPSYGHEMAMFKSPFASTPAFPRGRGDTPDDQEGR